MLDKGPNDQLREALQIMAIADEKAGCRQDAAQWRERAEALTVA
jgi:hypothetical protein